MTTQLDYNDHQCAQAASELLRRHGGMEPEANITSAVRDFLIASRLAKSDEIAEENPPSGQSRSAVDLTALDTLIEVKRRIGNGAEPNPEYVGQLDEYLAQSEAGGKGVRMGLLTDGKHWVLRWPYAGPVKIVEPYAFNLQGSGDWFRLYEWLQDQALVSIEEAVPDRTSIVGHFGPNSPRYEQDIAVLKSLYEKASGYETVLVKRQLWYDLLRTALGEIARDDEELDDLFIRHTYLSAVIGMVVQASFRTDIRQIAEVEPEDLLIGRRFRNQTGLKGIVESDFFAWPNEVGGQPLLKNLARRIARFDWRKAPPDVAAILYQTVIPADERRQLGEYYTPDWLARQMVRELVEDPLEQRVLDPSCGSGTFLAEAVKHFIDRAAETGKFVTAKEKLDKLRDSVIGIDVHPVAVHLARAAWVLAAQPVIEETVNQGFDSSLSLPVYLGDSLQLRFRPGDLFAEHEVTIQVEGESNIALTFPVSLVDRAEDFDALMGDVAEYIENGEDPTLALSDNLITDPAEQTVLRETIVAMQKLHEEGRDHIWAYYTRNLVRPVALSRSKVDVVIGNPPWLSYRNSVSTLRTELEELSRNLYGIWAGGPYANRQDVASLFFARCVDLYLTNGGVIGMVLPHSALQTGQYGKWRTGKWEALTGRILAADFGLKVAWDLERLEPNTFFPIPASVVFAQRLQLGGTAQPLSGEVERWLGKMGSDNIRRELVPITDTSVAGDSPYSSHSRQGATIVPRCLFFVNETENTALIQLGQTITVNPRRGSQDKKPWKELDLATISGQTIESRHIFDIHLGETIVPYATLNPLKAALPLKRGDAQIHGDSGGVGGIRLNALEQRMRERWRTISNMWETNKKPVNKLNLLERLDYHRDMSAQLEWQLNRLGRPLRIVYTQNGVPTAALINDDEALIDTKLYWIVCKNIQEADYLLAIINSNVLYKQ